MAIKTLPNGDKQGLSTDTKPTVGIQDGTYFIELNTGKVFTFSVGNTNPATSNEWWGV